jgi:hypothetical protein
MAELYVADGEDSSSYHLGDALEHHFLEIKIVVARHVHLY